MKVYTSYFYQVRFFKPYMIPLSTAMWDPKWFHNFKGSKHIFYDKNGIVNGAKAIPFVPGEQCEGLCDGSCIEKHPESCEFMNAYRKQLSKLKYKKVMSWLEAIGNNLVKDGQEPYMILLFHEKPDNPCSERVAVQEWFADHGLEVTELEYPIKDYY